MNTILWYRNCCCNEMW